MNNNEEGKNIMSKKELDEYLDKMKKYTEKITNGQIPAKESLDSLVKTGICDENKKLNEVYSLV